MSIKDQVASTNILPEPQIQIQLPLCSHALSAGNLHLLTSITIVQQETRKFGGDFVEKSVVGLFLVIWAENHRRCQADIESFSPIIPPGRYCEA